MTVPHNTRLAVERLGEAIHVDYIGKLIKVRSVFYRNDVGVKCALVKEPIFVRPLRQEPQYNWVGDDYVPRWPVAVIYPVLPPGGREAHVMVTSYRAATGSWLLDFEPAVGTDMPAAAPFVDEQNQFAVNVRVVFAWPAARAYLAPLVQAGLSLEDGVRTYVEHQLDVAFVSFADAKETFRSYKLLGGPERP